MKSRIEVCFLSILIITGTLFSDTTISRADGPSDSREMSRTAARDAFFKTPEKIQQVNEKVFLLKSKMSEKHELGMITSLDSIEREYHNAKRDFRIDTTDRYHKVLDSIPKQLADAHDHITELNPLIENKTNFHFQSQTRSLIGNSFGVSNLIPESSNFVSALQAGSGIGFEIGDIYLAPGAKQVAINQRALDNLAGQAHASDVLPRIIMDAQTDAEFAARINPILSARYGITLTSNIEDDELAAPAAANLYHSPEHQKTLAKVNGVEQEIADKLAGENGPLDHQKISEAYNAAVSKHSSELVPNAPEQNSPDKTKKELAEDFETYKAQAQDAIGFCEGLGTLAAVYGLPKQAQVMSKVMPQFISTTVAVVALRTSTINFTKFGTEGLMSSLNMIGALAGLVGTIGELFSSGSDGTQAILEAIRELQIQMNERFDALSRQIADIQSENRTYFRVIDDKLNDLLIAVSTGFSQIANQIEGVRGDITEIKQQIYQLENSIKLLQVQTLEFSQSHFEFDLEEAQNRCIETRGDPTMEPQTQKDCLIKFYTVATALGRHPEYSVATTNDGSSFASLEQQIGSHSAFELLQFLGKFNDKNNIGSKILGDGRDLALNPSMWMTGVDNYLETLKSWPKFKSPIIPPQLFNMIRAGNRIQSFISAITVDPKTKSPLAGIGRFQKLDALYGQAIDQLKLALQAETSQFSKNNLTHDPQLDIYQAEEKSKDHPLTIVAGIQPCAESKSAVPNAPRIFLDEAATQSLVKTPLGRLAQIGESVGLGTFAACYDLKLSEPVKRVVHEIITKDEDDYHFSHNAGWYNIRAKGRKDTDPQVYHIELPKEHSLLREETWQPFTIKVFFKLNSAAGSNVSYPVGAISWGGAKLIHANYVGRDVLLDPSEPATRLGKEYTEPSALNRLIAKEKKLEADWDKASKFVVRARSYYSGAVMSVSELHPLLRSWRTPQEKNMYLKYLAAIRKDMNNKEDGHMILPTAEETHDFFEEQKIPYYVPRLISETIEGCPESNGSDPEMISKQIKRNKLSPELQEAIQDSFPSEQGIAVEDVPLRYTFEPAEDTDHSFSNAVAEAIRNKKTELTGQLEKESREGNLTEAFDQVNFIHKVYTDLVTLGFSESVLTDAKLFDAIHGKSRLPSGDDLRKLMREEATTSNDYFDKALQSSSAQYENPWILFLSKVLPFHLVKAPPRITGNRAALLSSITAILSRPDYEPQQLASVNKRIVRLCSELAHYVDPNRADVRSVCVNASGNTSLMTYSSQPDDQDP